ncbi:hypothetical protein GCM10017744_002150 [Streptomyces antimycoticus]|uniref:Uncharacterized protein n=1 Tax=Streptomyces antimycoticus TaxID=68175 RepID=A0A4D4KQY8_9ACTN|nr:hypothetical protein SANT12839_097500 [Streptomyces antimycoticus]
MLPDRLGHFSKLPAPEAECGLHGPILSVRRSAGDSRGQRVPLDCPLQIYSNGGPPVAPTGAHLVSVPTLVPFISAQRYVVSSLKIHRRLPRAPSSP